jgi:polygalacturonase
MGQLHNLRRGFALLTGLFCTVLLLVSASFPQQNTSIVSTAPSEISPIVAPFAMPQLSRPVFPAKKYDIRDFGAKEGGSEKNTTAIRKAIETAAEAGGGTVVVPAGKWLTGAIHLENNINLFLATNAELLFSQDPTDYLPSVFSRHEDVECYKFSSFIYANGKTNIAITGEGTLNGQGKPWWDWKESRKESEEQLRAMGDKDVPTKERIFDGRKGNFLRPAFFQPMDCKNILVEGVTFLYGAFWTITPTYCENVIVRKVRITTEGAYGHTQNGDGVDPSSCKNVLIEYCEFDTGDDCIAIKAGRDRDGMRVGIPTENVVVRHCVGLRGHGGIVIGSETSGGIRNVYAYDCRFNGTDRIVRVKTARGRGGTIENMWFRELSADTIEQEALHINMLYTGKRLPPEPVTNTTPRIRNLHYSKISCSFGKKGAIEILGLPEMPVENVTFDSIFITAAKGVICRDAKNIQLKNVFVRPQSGPLIDILDGEKITIDGLEVPDGADPVLYVDGAKTSEIVLSNTKTEKAKSVVRYGEKASLGSVTIK